jgi:hypothetical protein
MSSSWLPPGLAVIAAIAIALPARCQDCTPRSSAVEPQPTMFCPSGQAIYNFTATFPDGHSVPDAMSRIGECVALYTCDAY